MTDPADTGALAGARPLFLLGAPRSGTTFVAKLLDSHPEVLCTNEVRFLTFLHKAGREVPTGDAGGLHCARVHGDAVVATLRAHARTLYDEIFARIARDQGRGPLRYYGDKNPHHADDLNLIAESFPEACFIHLQRAPRDVVCSILEMHARMGLLPAPDDSGWQLTEADVRKRASSVRTLVRSEVAFIATLPPERAISLTYEELLDDVDGWIDRLFRDFLGLGSTAAPRSWYEQEGRRDSHGVNKGSIDFRARSVGRAERLLRPDLLAAIDDVFSSR